MKNRNKNNFRIKSKRQKMPKKGITKGLLASAVIFGLIGCGSKKEEAIENNFDVATAPIEITSTTTSIFLEQSADDFSSLRDKIEQMKQAENARKLLEDFKSSSALPPLLDGGGSSNGDGGGSGGYTKKVPCGSPVPPGMTCACNCVPESF